MRTKRRKLRLNLSWNRIPRRRRQVYVYTLLLLGAIVGNNINHALSGPAEELQEMKGPSRVENMKAKTNLLYR